MLELPHPQPGLFSACFVGGLLWRQRLPMREDQRIIWGKQLVPIFIDSGQAAGTAPIVLHLLFTKGLAE